MKLFIKILLFAFVAFTTNVKVASAATVFPNIQEATAYSSFHTEIPKTVLKVIENDLKNCCQNGNDLIDYRNRDIGVEVVAAKTGTNLVYQGFDKAGVVRYVGITEREAAVRFGEHLSSGTAKSLLQYRVVDGATGLSRTQARVWEQTLINQYGLQKNGGLLLNKINSIAPKNWWQYGIK